MWVRVSTDNRQYRGNEKTKSVHGSGCGCEMMTFRRKGNPETYPCLPNSLRSSGSCPTVYRVQWYPEIIISELAPDFDVVGILFQMLGEDGVGVTADRGTTVAEDSGNALKLVP